MKNIKSFLYGLFHVEYRGTYWINGRSESIYGNKYRDIKHKLIYTPDAVKWSIYKTGPFYIKERLIDYAD